MMLSFALKRRSWVTFELFVGLFVVNWCVYFVVIGSLVHDNSNSLFVFVGVLRVKYKSYLNLGR